MAHETLDLFQTIILALVQGVTEFLPVSSSAHLILVPRIFGWQDQGLIFDIAVHLGTLVAVIVYFRHDLLKLRKNKKLFWDIFFTTIPVGLVGLFIRNKFNTNIRHEHVIVISTIFFALLLLISNKISYSKNNSRVIRELNKKDILFIGLMQALSLIPGASRSGVTLTAGLFAGFSKGEAARFSFLLSIPVIILAGGLEFYKVSASPELINNTNWQSLGIGFLVSMISGYFAIHYFIKLLIKVGVIPFVIYRLILGIGLIYFFYLEKSILIVK